MNDDPNGVRRRVADREMEAVARGSWEEMMMLVSRERVPIYVKLTALENLEDNMFELIDLYAKESAKWKEDVVSEKE